VSTAPAEVRRGRTGKGRPSGHDNHGAGEPRAPGGELRARAGSAGQGGAAGGPRASHDPAATPAATFGTLYVAQRRRFAVAAAVGAAGVVTHAVRGLWRPIGGLPYIWWLILVIVAEAALVGWGQLTQARRALIASLEERARRADQVMLDGRPGEQLRIDIRNPLGGPAAPAAIAGSGTGLIGLTERVRLAGGELDQQVTPAGEFRLSARLPWPA